MKLVRIPILPYLAIQQKKKEAKNVITYPLSFTTFHCSPLSLYLAISVL